DMQEDKEPAFDALDSVELAILAMTGMVRDMTPNTDAMRKAAGAGYSTATDIADWLVREKGMPFRQAHHVTGRIVALASERGVDLEDLSTEDFTGIDPALDASIHDVLGVDKSVASRTSYGGTAPENVKTQAQGWIERLKKEQQD
ncbi:MAG: argininosuccinate lyase, partial [Rhodobiaceae bacterium]|nr:argininosuccinate lyase [Rhodobiaceae bacterium]